jgi:hypothetical protein
MAKSQLALFIQKIKTDEALRQKVIHAEKSAEHGASKLKKKMEDLRKENLDPIRKIAKEAGFDITSNIGLPALDVAPHDHEKENLGDCCYLTCCWVETSVGPWE